MKFLLSNDDGYFSPGLTILAQALATQGEVMVVAPERDRSGASNSLTLDRPLTARLASNGFYAVNGTPTDCVHLALSGLMDEKPDMVIAGINHGANLGEDILYSGTVAAATEAFMLGVPAIAVSYVSRSGPNLACAARVVLDLIARHRASPLSTPTLLNVNIPDLDYAQLGGIEVTRLGRRHQAEPVVKAHNPRGEAIYWVGNVGAVEDNGPGSDFHAIDCGRVSITPLQIDLTAYSQQDALRTWLS